jgi:asparagine synthase (glutamine-hydrolysing)
MREEELYNEIKNTFNNEKSKKYFNNKLLIKMLDEHKNKKKDNYRKIWNIYCFLKWYEVFF